MEFKSPELNSASEVSPNCTTPTKRKVTIDEVRDLLCEYVSQHNYSLVKHIDRGYVYAKETQNTQELLQFIMQSARAQLIGQMDPQNSDYVAKANNINQVFDAIKHVLQLIPNDGSYQSKSQMAAFITGNLIKFIA